MVIHPRDHDLVIGTHGRAAYILDDIQPLRAWTEDVSAKKIHLFPIIDAYQFRTNFLGYGYLTPGNMEFIGKNRPYGALITYSLGKVEAEKESQESKPEGKIAIEILDAEGKVAQTLKGPKKPGLNRVTWDLRHEAFKSISSPYGGFFTPSGPYVMPGSYTARIKIDGETVEQSFHVHADPRTQIPEQGRKAKYELIMTNGKYVEAVTKIYRNIQESDKAVTEILSKLDQFPEDRRETIKDRGNALKEKLKTFSLQISPPKDRSGIFRQTELEPQLTGLGSRLETSLDAPTAGQMTEFKRLEAKTKETLSKVNQCFAEEYKDFATLVGEAGFSPFPKIEAVTLKELP
jgi:hypothetical protein